MSKFLALVNSALEIGPVSDFNSLTTLVNNSDPLSADPMILTPNKPASENVKFKLSTTSAYEFLLRTIILFINYYFFIILIKHFLIIPREHLKLKIRLLMNLSNWQMGTLKQ